MRIVSVLAFLVAFATSPCLAQVLWYGGDAGALSIFNNSTQSDGSSTSRVLDDFQVPAGERWHVTALFSNNVTAYPLSNDPVTQAEWSIRTGVAPGVFGTVLYSGISPVSITPTGRVYGPDTEYSFTVTGLSFDLDPGVYFMTVSPITTVGLYSVGGSTGANSVGVPGAPGFFQEYVQASPPLHFMTQVLTAGNASLGVIGTAQPVPVPAFSAVGYAALLTALAVLGVMEVKR